MVQCLCKTSPNIDSKLLQFVLHKMHTTSASYNEFIDLIPQTSVSENLQTMADISKNDVRNMAYVPGRSFANWIASSPSSDTTTIWCAWRTWFQMCLALLVVTRRKVLMQQATVGFNIPVHFCSLIAYFISCQDFQRYWRCIRCLWQSVTSASAKRAMSKVKLVKNRLRSTMTSLMTTQYGAALS